MKNEYIITVEFQVHSMEMMESFIRHVTQNASDSLKFEPGCLRFDVLVPSDSETSIFLYEIYKNKDAFGLHLLSKHFEVFDKSIKKLVFNKIVREFSSAQTL